MSVFAAIRSRSDRYWLSLLLAVLLLGVPTLSTGAEGSIRLFQGELRNVGLFLALDARFDVELSDEARDALTSGVPLTLAITANVIEPRWWWWWDAELVQRTVRVTLRYHALSRRYVVHNDLNGERRTFFRADVAMMAWGAVSGMRLLQTQRLGDGGEYLVRARARLDLDALPHPLRTVAYVSPEWRIVSDWYQWPVER